MSRFNDDFTRTQCSVFVHEPRNRSKTAGTIKNGKDVREIDNELPSIRLNNSDNADPTSDDASPASKKKKAITSADYGIEEKLIAAVWVHERPYTLNSIAQIKEDFYRRFDRNAPAKATLLRWEHFLFSTGSIKDPQRCPRSGNRKTKSKPRNRGKSTKKKSGESEGGAGSAAVLGSEGATA